MHMTSIGTDRARPARGFTLVELMVALVVGLLVMLAAVAFITALMRSHTEDLRVTRLTQEVRALSEVISREVRRARFVADPIGLVAQGSAAAGNDLLEARDAATNAPVVPGSEGDCIVLTYDEPPDPPAIGTLVSRAIYRGADGRVYLNSNSANCSGGSAISSPQVQINTLAFQQAGGFRMDQTLTASLRDGPPSLKDLRRTFRQTVYVRSGQVN
jgi:prepilin-type N-terminal cleavage/methylation domain-containing protein